MMVALVALLRSRTKFLFSSAWRSPFTNTVIVPSVSVRSLMVLDGGGGGGTVSLRGTVAPTAGAAESVANGRQRGGQPHGPGHRHRPAQRRLGRAPPVAPPAPRPHTRPCRA